MENIRKILLANNWVLADNLKIAQYFYAKVSGIEAKVAPYSLIEKYVGTGLSVIDAAEKAAQDTVEKTKSAKRKR